MGRCHLRQLPIHPELVGDLWCHHWTARPPRLPVISGGASAEQGLERGAIQQLCLASMVPEG